MNSSHPYFSRMAKRYSWLTYRLPTCDTLVMTLPTLELSTPNPTHLYNLARNIPSYLDQYRQSAAILLHSCSNLCIYEGLWPRTWNFVRDLNEERADVHSVSRFQRLTDFYGGMFGIFATLLEFQTCRREGNLKALCLSLEASNQLPNISREDIEQNFWSHIQAILHDIGPSSEKIDNLKVSVTLNVKLADHNQIVTTTIHDQLRAFLRPIDHFQHWQSENYFDQNLI